ncbi:branched-chain amino acid ABC transporter permease [Sphaerisporangium melleum]|uniref:Branched-chain amino acid ABC transporter permease n=1 Tax=Sphaerisporangium melleum TaxID=321316 RepID=A0A917R487_9ACTN|nr:branched-chain amino acid ABC transporter permease [Sphaerisporangium melleum]GGK89388.1 branched-chain amino acid ABC transporter permease [Sphaerisporangium melleum]GII72491.1 branched-chain amino acid ABC transporter permease [Sphaerisporangium melleum]
MIASRPAARPLLLATGLLLALALPWMVYPPVALDIACWALFAAALDLLLGFTGLLSFGHAAFWGTSAYVAGLIALRSGLPFPVAVLGGAASAALLALPIGYLSVRLRGIYFAMVTLAFAQMVYFVVNQWRGLTGGENGLQGVPRELFGLDLSDSFLFYYAGLPLVLLGFLAVWRIVRSPFGRVLASIRDNPARAQALGYPVDRYRLLAFVLSAALSGLAGGLFAVGHGFASLENVYWTTSGQVVMMVVLGGIGTLWGGVLGAALVVLLNDYLVTSGFEGIGIVTGAIFVIIVLVFRRGVWGTARDLVRPRSGGGRRDRPPGEADGTPARPQGVGSPV